MVYSFLLAHGRQILGIHQHPEEMVKGVSLDELLEASGVEAEGAECVWERSQHLACHWNLHVCIERDMDIWKCLYVMH